MEIGLVGAGKIGMGMLRRLLGNGHTVHVYDVNSDARRRAGEAGGQPADSLEQLVSNVSTPRLLWLMLPAGEAVHTTVSDLTKLLDPQDTVIDGGNSFYKDSQAHAARLEKRGIAFLDVGVSGGVSGADTGYALMIGGPAELVARYQELWTALEAQNATAHVGPIGAGHFVKMVHNAVEYGMMQAIGEGFDLLKNGPFPDLSLGKVAELWSHGTIVRSFLMELAARALNRDGQLHDIAGYVDDSGEGRWSVTTAVEHAVPFWVNTAALYARFDSRQTDSFAAKLLAALRREFGGHPVKKK